MSVTIKIFYEKSNGSPEIRRFPLDTNSGDCFLQTKEKVKNLYPALRGGAFQLFWKDSDGDRIAFSSAEEMKDALNCVTDGVFRVYIPEVESTPEPKGNGTEDKAPKEDKQKQQQQQSQAGASSSTSSSTSWSSSHGQSQSQHQGEDTLHPNVICDGCEGPVVGIRFKCCICPDFDLCSGCEKKGVHSEHDMIKMTTPRMEGPFGFMPPNFSEYVHMGAHNAAHAAAQAAASAAASSFGRAHGQAGTGQGNQSGQGGQAPRDDYLRNVGANIAAFLDPFGIDVTYDVHHNNGQRQHGRWSGPCGGNRGPHQSFWRGGRGCPAWQGMDKRAGRPKNPSDSGDATTEKGSKKTDSMDTEETHTKENTTASQGTPMEDNSQEKSRPGSDEWTFVPDDGSEVHVTVPNPNTPIPMPAPTTAKPNSTNQSPQDKNSTSTPTQATRPSVGPGGIYPDLRLQQSLEQMLAMGFSNTDNWLADLLVDNSCDIGLTLDAIKAKATQQLDSLRK